MPRGSVHSKSLSGKGYQMVCVQDDFGINMVSSIYWCIWPSKTRTFNGRNI